MAMRIIGIGFIVVVLVGGAIIGLVFRDQLTGSAAELRVGDCIDLPADMEEVSDVQHRPCTEAHDAEVFVVRDYEGATDYPTTVAFDNWVNAQCTGEAFSAYVGATYDSREDVGAGYFYPLEEGWKQGDREMVCYLVPTDGGKVNASYRQASN
jgi:hypothetical protein